MGIPANLLSGIQYSRLPPKNKPRFHHYRADWQYIWCMLYKAKDVSGLAGILMHTFFLIWR
jgi:hypothetical protein